MGDGVATGMSIALAEDEDSEEELIGELTAGTVTTNANEDAQDKFEHPDELLLLLQDDEADEARALHLNFFRFPSESPGVCLLRFLF